MCIVNFFGKNTPLMNGAFKVLSIPLFLFQLQELTTEGAFSFRKQSNSA